MADDRNENRHSQNDTQDNQDFRAVFQRFQPPVYPFCTLSETINRDFQFRFLPTINVRRFLFSSCSTDLQGLFSSLSGVAVHPEAFCPNRTHLAFHALDFSQLNCYSIIK
jgi:hypothetical protein